MKELTRRGAKGRATAGRPYGGGKSGGDKKDCLARHRGRCRICQHAEREEIEREFLDWVSPREIAETWKIASYRAIYRHAHAVGLFQRRRENRLAALDRIIERVGEVKVTAAAVVAAIRLSAKLEWEENHRGGGGLGGSPPASAAGGTGTVRGDGVQPGREFVLSLEGLPRTDAVTGHEGRDGCIAKAVVCAEGTGRVSRTQTRRSEEPECQGHRLKPVPPAGGRPGGSPLHRGMANERGSRRPQVAPTKGDGGAAGGKKNARAGHQKTASQGVAAPLERQSASVEPDPRVVLGEDGRVAGVPWPWPKGKITFAPRVRWRPGRGG